MNSNEVPYFTHASTGNVRKKWWIYFIVSTIVPLIVMLLILPQAIFEGRSSFAGIMCIFLIVLALSGFFEIERIGSITLFKNTFIIKSILNFNELVFRYEEIDDIKFFDVKLKLWSYLKFDQQRMVELTMPDDKKYYFASDDIHKLEELLNALHAKYMPIIKRLISADTLELKPLEFGQNLRISDGKLLMNPAYLPLEYASSSISPDGTINIVCNKRDGSAPKVWLPLIPERFNRTLLLKYILDVIVPKCYT